MITFCYYFPDLNTNPPNHSDSWCFEGFRCVPVQLDGNCLFAALADQLHVNGIDVVQRSAMDVRQELVNFICSESTLGSHIQTSLDDSDTLEKYLDRTSKNGT